MNQLLHQAECLKLARAMRLEPSDFPDLSGVSIDALRGYRHAANDALFNRYRKQFSRLAAATKLLPVALAAKITELAIGPFLAGRVASEMGPEMAVALSKRLPIDFLAECCLAIDPVRAVDIVQAMPVQLVIDVSAALEQREQFIVMANFVEALEDDVLRTVMETISDAALLHCGLYVESAERLEQIVWQMSDERLSSVIATASTQGLEPELELMIARGSNKLQQRLTALR